MQALTSSFPSSTHGHNGVQLENIIFYSRPASAKTRETTPIDTDESSDVEMIFAEASQQEWVAAPEQLDPAGGFDIMGEDIRDAIDTSSAAQAIMPPPAHLQDFSTPLCNGFSHSCGGVADRAGSALDVWGTEIESVPGGISDTVQLHVQHYNGDDGITVQDCPPDDGASLALWAAFRGDASIPVPATDHPTSPPRILKTNGPDLPLHTAQLSPGSLNVDLMAADKSLLEAGDCEPQPQLIDERERNSTGPTLVESSLVEQDHILGAACDMSADTVPSAGSTCDRVHSSYSAGTTVAADTEGSDSDELPLRSRRRQTRPRTPGFNSPSPPLTPRSSVHSIG